MYVQCLLAHNGAALFLVVKELLFATAVCIRTTQAFWTLCILLLILDGDFVGDIYLGFCFVRVKVLVSATSDYYDRIVHFSEILLWVMTFFYCSYCWTWPWFGYLSYLCWHFLVHFVYNTFEPISEHPSTSLNHGARRKVSVGGYVFFLPPLYWCVSGCYLLWFSFYMLASPSVIWSIDRTH